MPPVSDNDPRMEWFDAPGETLAALALYTATAVGDEPGDGRDLALCWAHDGALVLAERDRYGGREAFEVINRHDLTPVATSGWEITPQAADEGYTELAAEGGVGGELHRIALERAHGPHAAGVPMAGWAGTWFRLSDSDVSSFWLVLYDERLTVRAAWAARTRG